MTIQSKKIGIMGGTFNPVHMGHLLLAECAREQAKLDQILFIPSGYSYMKEDQNVLSGAERLKLVSLSIADNPYFSLSDMELTRDGYTYTYETLELLCKDNPDAAYFFITGADSLLSLDRWKFPERILSNCSLVTAVRGDTELQEVKVAAERLEKKYGAHILLLDMPRTDISSTDIRARLASGRSIRYMVPEPVAQYIYEKQLFIR